MWNIHKSHIYLVFCCKIGHFYEFNDPANWIFLSWNQLMFCTYLCKDCAQLSSSPSPILGGVTETADVSSGFVEILRSQQRGIRQTHLTHLSSITATLMSSLVLSLLLYYIFRVSECFNKSLKCSATKTAWRSWVAVHNSLELVKQPLVYIQLLS